MEHHQTFERPRNGAPGWLNNTNFFEKNFLSPKIYKTAQNIDMWDERRDS